MTRTRQALAAITLAAVITAGTAGPANALGPRSGYTNPCGATALIISPFAAAICKYHHSLYFGWR